MKIFISTFFLILTNSSIAQFDEGYVDTLYSKFVFPEDCHAYPLLFRMDWIYDSKVISVFEEKRVRKYLGAFLRENDFPGELNHKEVTKNELKNYSKEIYKYEVRGVTLKSVSNASSGSSEGHSVSFQFIDRQTQKKYELFGKMTDCYNGVDGLKFFVSPLKTKTFFESLRRITDNLREFGPKKAWDVERELQNR